MLRFFLSRDCSSWRATSNAAIVLLACGSSSDEVWLSEQAPYRPAVVPAIVPQGTAIASWRHRFTSASVGAGHICGARGKGYVQWTQ